MVFFGSANSVLSSIMKPRENVLMLLLYSNCVPKLTFGAIVKDLSSSEMNQFNVAVNTAVRRIFGFRQWQSIRQIRDVYNYDPIEVLYEKAKKRFHGDMLTHDNSILKFLEVMRRDDEEKARNLVP